MLWQELLYIQGRIPLFSPCTDSFRRSRIPVPQNFEWHSKKMSTHDSHRYTALSSETSY
jgi:hypothetical protein